MRVITLKHSHRQVGDIDLGPLELRKAAPLFAVVIRRYKFMKIIFIIFLLQSGIS